MSNLHSRPWSSPEFTPGPYSTSLFDLYLATPAKHKTQRLRPIRPNAPPSALSELRALNLLAEESGMKPVALATTRSCALEQLLTRQDQLKRRRHAEKGISAQESMPAVAAGGEKHYGLKTLEQRAGAAASATEKGLASYRQESLEVLGDTVTAEHALEPESEAPVRVVGLAVFPGFGQRDVVTLDEGVHVEHALGSGADARMQAVAKMALNSDFGNLGVASLVAVETPEIKETSNATGFAGENGDWEMLEEDDGEDYNDVEEHEGYRLYEDSGHDEDEDEDEDGFQLI